MSNGNSSATSIDQVREAFGSKFPGVDVVYFATLTRSQGFARDHRVIVYRGNESLLQQLGLVKANELPAGRRRTRGSGYAPNLRLITREQARQLQVWCELDGVDAGQFVAELRGEHGEPTHA